MAAMTAAPVNQRAGIRRFLDKHEEAIAGVTFVLPAGLLVCAFTIFPVIYSLYLSFVQWDYLSPTPLWVGLANYKRLLVDPEFLRAIKNTAYYALVSVPLGTLVSLGLALLVARKLPGVGIFRTAYFAPIVTSAIAVGMVWSWLYSGNLGLINYLLSLVGIRGPNWLGQSNTAMPALIIMAIWYSAGYNMMIFLAGLQNIPQEYYDAAAVDGATRWQTFRKVTLPLLSPTTFFVIIVGVIVALQIFDQVYILTRGGPMGSTQSMVYVLYFTAFRDLYMGRASAMAYVIFVILFILTLINFRVGSRFVQYE